ncbi:uncharacterized protein LOC116023266 isoform X1 [Ipomoea triloba]|uniref:uncharacterized protein LOC116023266 isoform X1 n=1 Tax=Ipomoea triloba TaxID=35885 RepID=UPI00125E10C9|nr:uncharacterized protein LOC116023266 isoform X1 [Ipomoea triloba]
MAAGDETDAPARKRLKTLEPPPIQSSSSDKGKSKVEISDSEGSESEICCGICLSEASAIIQGCIDSCAHFFCFLCIMEWSKVESRCPICKARFSAIRRPPKPPVFPSDRVVRVPLRDQVYDYSGNLTTGSFDPYAEVQCNVCHSSADDSLLLLCDLCDSASHTYCVGLGATVPEGDWFCSDCSLLRTEHAKTDTGDNCDNQLKSAACHGQISSTGEVVSIFEIVREPQTSYVEGLSLVNSDTSSVSPQVVTCKRETLSNDVAELASSRTKLSAKTLWHCRSVNDRIRTLRENWDGLQSGSLYFPSNKNHDGDIAKQKPETGCDKGSDEINKAWKMLDIAKSVVRNHGGSKTLTQASKQASKKMNTCAEACGGHLNSRSSHRQQPGFSCIGQEVPHRYHPLNKNYHMNRSQTSGQQKKQENVALNRSPNVKECFLEKMNTYKQTGGGHSNSLSRHRQNLGNSGPGNHLQYHPRDKNYQMNRSQMSGQQQKQDTATSKVPPNVQECFSTTHLALHSEMTSSKEDHASFQPNVCDKSGHMKKKDLCTILPGSNSSMRSAQTVSSISHAEEELGLSSSRNKAKHLKDKVGPEKNNESSKAKDEYDEAKTEIQSLVKLNLKLLSKDKKLEAEKFKEIARLSTHSILAACGLEKRRSGIPAFPNSICFHVNEASEIRRSTLMPNSCRECFFLFVKDVVSSIMLERTQRRG